MKVKIKAINILISKNLYNNNLQKYKSLEYSGSLESDSKF